MGLSRVVSQVAGILAVGLLGGTSVSGQETGSDRPRPAIKVDFKKLEFMSGCWAEKRGKDEVIEEIWTRAADNLLLATTRYLTKNRATSFEFTKIHATDSTVVFSASSEGKEFDSYTLKKLVDEYVEFENLSKKFPQRIIYRLASDGALIARNEGEGATSIEARFSRVKCPGVD